MPQIVSAYCSECDGDKNHKKLSCKTAKSYSKSTEEFSNLQCMGCNAISFLQTIKLSKKSKIFIENEKGVFQKTMSEVDEKERSLAELRIAILTSKFGKMCGCNRLEVMHKTDQ